MANADAQAQEILTDVIDDIAQAVVPAMTTGFFQAVITGFQVEVIVHHQHLFGSKLIVIDQGRDGLAATILPISPLKRVSLRRLMACSRAISSASQNPALCRVE